MQSCILWQRVAAFGWGFIFSVLLHFILILTEKTALLRKWWIYIALYLPAIVTVCAFGLPIGLNSVPYQFTSTSLGWIKETQISGWDYFQWVYYTVFTITGLVLIWLWGRRSLNKQVKKQALVLFISFTAAYLLGTLTDVVFQWFPIAIPPMSPIIMLIPVSAVCYIIKHYGF
jgi:heme A synthase